MNTAQHSTAAMSTAIGEELELQFVERIRSEKKYSSEADLAAQIHKDVEIVSGILSERGLLRVAP